MAVFQRNRKLIGNESVARFARFVTFNEVLELMCFEIAMKQ